VNAQVIMKKEIEVKFKVNNYQNTLKKLEDIFGESGPEFYEKTYGFFTPDDWSWKEAGIFPRIKETKDNLIFGIKIRPKKQDENYFERDEWEIEINDKQDRIHLLKMLGYSHIVIFEKFRRKWQKNNFSITLDRLPFGEYVEIESTKENIEKLAKKLGLKDRITKAYLGVWQDLRKGNDPEDAMF